MLAISNTSRDLDSEKSQTEEINTGVKSLLTVKQFCTAFPWPSESAMRSYIYRAEMLGISDAFVRVGRRVLITPQSFFSLIKQIESPSIKGTSNETASWRKRDTILTKNS